MKLGSIIASREIAREGKPVGYLYHERPSDELDGGWRVFSGHETQDYVDDDANLDMYNASTIVAIDPSIAAVLGHDYPVAFERDADTGELVEIEAPSDDAPDNHQGRFDDI